MGYWNRIRRKRARWSELSAPERGCLIQALLLLPLVSVGRRVLSFRRLQQGLACAFPLRTGPGQRTNQALATARESARTVQIAARHAFPPVNCLDRSLALWALLRRRGLETELQLGVRRDDGQFAAHAWLEFEGEVLNDRDDVRAQFAALDVASQFRT